MSTTDRPPYPLRTEQAAPLADSRRKKIKWLLAGLALLAAVVTFLGESETLAPLFAGTPTFDSLDVLSGTVVQVGVCVGRRGPSSVPVWLMSNGKRVETHLPCTSEILGLRNDIGLPLEVRSRAFSPSILDAPYREVWSVKTGSVDLYDYQARAERSRPGWFTYFLAVLFPIAELLIFGMAAWGMLRKHDPDVQN